MLLFWTFAFPIILGTFFQMAFSDIEKEEQFDIMEIAIVKNSKFEQNPIFKNAFSKLGDKENKKRLFSIQYVSKKSANRLLQEDKIIGYLLLEDQPKVVIKENGTNETIFKSVVEEISQTEKILWTSASYKLQDSLVEPTQLNDMYNRIYEEALEIFNTSDSMLQDTSSSHLSYTMIEFYTLIAMTCLYGGILGMVSVNQNLANMSKQGKRVGVSPISKGKLIFSSVLASYVVQILGLALLFLYTIFCLHVDYGDYLFLTILLSLVGSLAGLSFGIFIASSLKASDNTKTGIMISLTMLGCFLSGMMGITMKYIIDKNLPLINKLNPVNMITDGFYTLYYYDTFERFYFNIFSLLLFSFVLIGISILSLRRQQYDSI